MRGLLALALVASLALNVAQVLWGPAAGAVSDMAVRLGLPAWREDLVASHQAELEKQRDLTRIAEAAVDAAGFGKVMLEGQEMSVSEAVLLVAERVAAIGVAAAAREAATAGAEAMPVLGIAVLAEAKAARLADSCAVDALLDDLSRGLDRSDAVSVTEICGLSAPDGFAIREASVPADAAWARARDYYPALPDLRPAPALENLGPMQAAIWDWAMSGMAARLRGTVLQQEGGQP